MRFAILILVCVAAVASDIDTALELKQQGKLEAAHGLLVSAAGRYRDAKDGANLARALGIAADISVSLGRYQAAIAEAAEVVKIRTALGDRAKLGDDYNTLGLAYQYQGNYAAALENYEKALDADRAAGDKEGEITRLDNIGNINYFEGRYSQALRAYQSAGEQLRGREESWSAGRRDVNVANLAALYQRLGQEPRALELYRELGDAARVLSASEQAQLLVNQGILYRRLGDPVKALELYRAAQSLYERDRHHDGEIGALRSIGIAQAMDFDDLAGARESFTRALELARESSSQRLIAQTLLYRGDVLRRLNQPAEARSDLQSAREIAQQAGLVEEQWKADYALGDFEGAVAIIESLRTSLRVPALRSDFLADKRDVFDALIASRLGDARASAAEIFDWMERSRARTLLDRVAARTPLARISLEDVQKRLARETTLIEYWTGAGQAAAIWATATASGIVRLRSVTPADVRILEGIPLGNHLIIVPDGPLTSGPFESIKLADGKFVIERADVTYLPSARFLGRRQSRSRYLTPWAAQMIALGDPPSRDVFGETSEPLPASAREVREIAQILPGRAQLHLGDDAKTQFVLQFSGAPVLHLATHAFVDAENPDRSRILLADRYLYQEEVYDLDLSRADLVTLSACDTGRGNFVRGETVQAFSQAFLAAGAQATLTTLWRVPDRPTAEFMQQFYARLARGESKAGALRDAKLRFLHSNSALADPKYWAAFVLTGNGARPIPLALDGWLLLALIALLVLLLVALRVLLNALPTGWSRWQGTGLGSGRSYPPKIQTPESADRR